MRIFVKVGLAIFALAIVVQALTALHQPIGASAPPAPTAPAPQTPAEKQAAKECSQWIQTAIKANVLASGQLATVDGELGILVNALPWYGAQFEVKETLLDQVDCEVSKGRDTQRIPLVVFDSRSHHVLGRYNGRRLTVD